MRDDLKLRELVAEQFKAWPKTVEPKALLELLDRFARKVAALTAQGETAPATDHTAARTTLREWVQEDVSTAASSLPAAESPRPSRLCARGEHEWCFNRSAEETHCSCPCHTKRAALPAAEGLEHLALNTAREIAKHDVSHNCNDCPVRFDFEVVVSRILTALRAVAEGRR